MKHIPPTKITLILLQALVITCLYLQAIAQQTLIPANEHGIDSLIMQKMKQSGIVGLGAAIIIDKKLVWKKGYGYADEQSKKPFTASTVMNIASVSKTITGACMMKAIEQGLIDLDEDINQYLPFKVINPYFPQDKITLRYLATHASGLADRYPFYTDSTYFTGKNSPEPLGVFLKEYFVAGGRYYNKANFLDHRPGTYRDYSNIATALAGYIVEQRTGMRLDAYSKRYIFDPLGMKNTGWFLKDIDRSNHTRLYDKKNNVVVQIPLYGCTTYPDGGVRTSVEDLTRFFICLLNGGVYNGSRILKESSVAEMTKFQFSEHNTPENVNPAKLNSGLFWATKMGGKRIGHNGSDPGVRTFMLADLKKEVAVVLFANTSLTEKEEDIYFDIYNLLYDLGIKLKN